MRHCNALVEFDSSKFHDDFRSAAKQLGVKHMKIVAKELRLNISTFRNLRIGKVPSILVVLVMADWAGLDPLNYLRRTDESS